MSVFNKIRSWFVVPVVALASFATAPAQGQLTCDAPLDAGLGVTEFATLLPFPPRQVEVACGAAPTVHHAVYLRFTAPRDGWYALHAVPTGLPSWNACIGALPSCDETAIAVFGGSSVTRTLCDSGNFTLQPVASATVHLLSGESRIIAVGGSTINDSGSGQLHVVRIGDTLMDGALELQLGTTAFNVAGLEPSVPYQGACSGWQTDRMGHASRFTFTPAKAGSYRFSFCGSQRNYAALSDSPDMPYASLAASAFGCPNNNGTQLTASLIAGTTYFIVAGDTSNNDACLTQNVTVEYIDPCPADLNDDDSVDGKDLALLIAGWGTAEADITNDGNTDGVDLGILLASWGPCTR